ncbi:MAG: YidB family protein [Chthoniobacterales bacterium]
MGLLDSLLGDLAGKQDAPGGVNPLAGAISGLLAQNGGLPGLMSKFSQGGLGEVFSSWVGTGANHSVSPTQIQSVLGSEQVQGLAAKLGIDPATAATMLAQYLPTIIDKLTPSGNVNDAAAQHPQGIAAMLPSLLASFGGGSREP